jgi:hypothetical protein
MFDYSLLKNIAEVEYQDIVDFTSILDERKLRLYIFDSSYIDIFYTPKTIGICRFAYHWERSHLDGTIYRHDNIPDDEWADIITFPKHFHYKNHRNVLSSTISDNPQIAIKEFLNFVRNTLLELHPQ